MMHSLTCKKCGNEVFSDEKMTTCHVCGSTEVKDRTEAITVIADRNDILEIKCAHGHKAFFNYVFDRNDAGVWNDEITTLWTKIRDYNLMDDKEAKHRPVYCPVCGKQETVVSWIYASLRFDKALTGRESKDYRVEGATPNL